MTSVYLRNQFGLVYEHVQHNQLTVREVYVVDERESGCYMHFTAL